MTKTEAVLAAFKRERTWQYVANFALILLGLSLIYIAHLHMRLWSCGVL